MRKLRKAKPLLIIFGSVLALACVLYWSNENVRSFIQGKLYKNHRTIQTAGFLLHRNSGIESFIRTSETTRLCNTEITTKLIHNNAELELNGMGIRHVRKFRKNFKVYFAFLYTDRRFNDPNDILDSESSKQIDIIFDRDVSGDQLKDGWEFRDGLIYQGISNFEEEVADMLVDVKKGQKMSILVSSDNVSFFLDEELLRTSYDPDFIKAVLSIYLVPMDEKRRINGKEKKEPDQMRELREGLLGRRNFDEDC